VAGQSASRAEPARPVNAAQLCTGRDQVAQEKKRKRRFPQSGDRDRAARRQLRFFLPFSRTTYSGCSFAAIAA